MNSYDLSALQPFHRAGNGLHLSALWAGAARRIQRCRVFWSTGQPDGASAYDVFQRFFSIRARQARQPLCLRTRSAVLLSRPATSLLRQRSRDAHWRTIHAAGLGSARANAAPSAAPQKQGRLDYRRARSYYCAADLWSGCKPDRAARAKRAEQ